MTIDELKAELLITGAANTFGLDIDLKSFGMCKVKFDLERDLAIVDYTIKNTLTSRIESYQEVRLDLAVSELDDLEDLDNKIKGWLLDLHIEINKQIRLNGVV